MSEPKLTAQKFDDSSDRRYVLMAGDMIFASPFVVNEDDDAHRLATGWNTLAQLRDLPRDELKRHCRRILDASNIRTSSMAGKHMIHAFWAGIVSLQSAVGLIPDTFVTICLLSGRYDDLVAERG